MDAEGLARLFAVPVAARVAAPEDYDAPLFPEEAEAILRAVPRRRREFAAGRACARGALAALGAPPAALPRRADRAPAWPGGYVGSLTHCEGFCAAVAAPAALVLGLGLDAETADPLPGQTPRHVCRPDELTRFARSGPPPGSAWSKLAFCAKEAFYKCYQPLTGRSLDFGDVSVWFAGAQGDAAGDFRIRIEAPEKAAGGTLEDAVGRWRIAGGRVYAGVTLAMVSTTLVGAQPGAWQPTA